MSYSAEDIALHLRDKESNDKKHRQYNGKDKKKSKEFRLVHTNSDLSS